MKKFIPNILIICTIIISYGQTLMMYFWNDDYTHLYFAQEKIVPDFPYHINTYIVYIINSLFGKNSFYYHLIALLFFAFCVYALFCLLHQIAKLGKYKIYLLTIIFASGYTGQQSLFMFAGDGAGVLLGLSFYLLSIASLIRYYKLREKKDILLSCLFFIATLESASHRFTGIIIPILTIIVLYSNKVKVKESVRNASVYLFMFLMQLFIHPISYVIDYGTYEVTGNAIFKADKYTIVSSVLSSLANSIVPTDLQQKFLANPILKYNLESLSTYFLPLIIYIILLSLMSNRIKRYSVLAIILYLLPAKLFFDKISDVVVLESTLIGLALFIFLVLNFIFSINKKQILIILSMFAGAALSLILVKPEFYISSDYRYMMALSFVAPLFITILYLSDTKNKSHVTTLTTIIAFILIFLHLYYAVSTQYKFVDKYSVTARRMFNSVRQEVEAEDTPIIIFTDASLKDLQYSVGDASRVGQLSTEAAFAYNLDVSIDKIIYPENLSSIQSIYTERNLPIENIYSFMVTPDSVVNTSWRLRESLLWDTSLNIDPNWDKVDNRTKADFSSYDINSMAPLSVVVKLDNTILKNVIHVSWEYDTFGSIFDSKEAQAIVENNSENGSHIQFIIPPGGTLLRNIYLQSQNNFTPSYVIISPIIQELVM
ncbi:hypothetical protein IPM62_04500 [Candidatus Woesebacteria bacterium]|nr:MAG: hypothetical protein IPM62_04500 [Candidatus Woesebacteria bacterium]